MKLQEYKLENWLNKEVKTTIEFEQFKVLLLRVNDTKIPPIKGLRNLLAVDWEQNILWIANTPANEQYGYYQGLSYSGNILRGISGSTLCEINPLDGTIKKQSFSK